MRWTLGAATVDRELAEGRLERVIGATADGSELLVSARALLASAGRERESNPEASYVLAYDAARKASTALLAQQGLRTKSTGHHVTVERVVRAQFGRMFDEFGTLRRRRSEIEYPSHPGDVVEAAEADEAVATATRIVDASSSLIEQLSFYD